MERDDRSMMAEEFTGVWWLFLIVGILWLLVALILFRFDLTSVAAVGALLGVLFSFAAVNEFADAGMRRDWRWLHIVMGVLFVIGAVWSFVHPVGTAVELASILGFLLILKGSFDLIVSVMSKEESELWWLGLVVGILEILLGFWASQSFIKPVLALIILWAGFMALFRGISEIVIAFSLRSARKRLRPAV
jgi:uncharacterized membrane protein HdeD (DUF308 family)